MSYPDFSEKYPQVPQATGATVLTVAELSVADFVIIINAGVASAVTTLGNLGTFLGNGTVIPLGGDVVGSTGTNSVRAIGGHSVDLGGTLSTDGAVAFEGTFPWVGNLTAATDVTFPAGTNTLGTMSSFTAITNAGTEIVQQGCTLTVVGLSSALAAGEILVGNAGGTAAPVAMSGDAKISNAGAVTVTGSNGEAFGALAFVNSYPANSLNGTTLASNVVNSSLTGVGTLASGALGSGFTALGYSLLPTSADIATIPFSLIGTLASGKIFPVTLTQAGTLLANGGTPQAYVGTDPTSTAHLTIETIHSGTVVTQGTVTISTAGSVTWPTFSAVSMAAGDTAAIVNQATADATLANLCLSIQFQKA